MSSDYQTKFIQLTEFMDWVLAKIVTSAPLGQNPSLNLIWVRPQKIAHCSLLWNFLKPINFLYLLDLVNVGRKTSMHTIDIIFNHSRQWQKIKYVSEQPPNVERAIFPNHLVIESIHLRYQPTLMISAQQSYLIFISDFESEKEQECLNAILASVNVIPQEYIVCIRWKSTYFHEFEQVIELAMDISTNCNGRSYFHNILLLFQNLFCEITHLLYLRFGNFFIFSQ